MASVANIVRFLPASGSTGDFVYSSGVTGYRTPVSSPALTDGATYRYRAESSDLSEWEIGEGAWTTSTTTLARTTIIHSSTGAKVNFTTAPNVAIVALADQFINPAGDTMTGSLVVPNASGLKIKDTDASHTLGLVGGSNLTADRTLTVTTGDASRTLTMSADATISGTNTGDQTASSLGLGTGDSPQFAGINVGHATDTTITRSGAGDIAVEGNALYRAGGTDVALADGGTGASLTDPNADRIMFWDDSAGAVAWLTAGTGLTITGTQIDAASSGGKAADQQVFTSSGTWTKPSGFGAKAYVLIQAWGAGGGGGRVSSGSNASGGGGGAYSQRWILLSSLGSTETVTIGAGGAGATANDTSGTAGGNSTFGSHVTAYGGGGGAGASAGTGSTGEGGQYNAAGGTSVRARSSFSVVTSVDSGATAYVHYHQNLSPFAGTAGRFSGQGLIVVHPTGDAEWGGAGGGQSATNTTGGTSKYGGNGGTGGGSPTAGSQPGGGGGAGASANAGAGGAGKCIITVFDGA